MSDRELLEAAARAAGVRRCECGAPDCTLFRDPSNHGNPWYPLTDDGDALRLAVRLRIAVKYHNNAPPELRLPRECATATADSGQWFAEAAVSGDENAATRRAIVRAAAALGGKVGG